jgi:CoB--CoM heterodisulfide reductase subunit B
MKDYAFFWGCTIPARFTFMEKSTRIVLDTLKVNYKDIEGFTCCPEKSIANNLNQELWEVLAARNVAVAEKEGLGIITACSGCYSVLKGVSSRLNIYPKKRFEVNKRLKSVDLEYKENPDIKHIVELLHDNVGLGKIKEKIVKSLKGLRIAVHYGCHLIRPSRAIHFDDPIKPRKYEKIIETLGAKVVEWKNKMKCCGGYLDRVDQSEKGYNLLKDKLNELKKLEVDAVTTTCPECFKVFDNNQFIIQRKERKLYNIPVFTLQELIGLSYGFSKEELGINEHRIDVSRFLEKFNGGKY